MAIECLTRKYDATGGRKSGDIVTVKLVPCVWGAGEGLPNYVIVGITNINKNQFAAYDRRHYEVSPGILLRSLFRFDLPNLPGYTDLIDKVEVTKSVAFDNVIDRRTE